MIGYITTADGKRFELKELTEGQRRRVFRPYALDIGYLVYSWNRLHDVLSVLFALVVQSTSPKLAGAIWHSTDNDFSQRKMLRAAVETADHLADSQKKDILTVLNKID